MSCPTTETLERLALGFLDDPAPARSHVSTCAGCKGRMETLKNEHAVLVRAAKAVPLPKVSRPRRPWRIAALAACAFGAVLLAMLMFPAHRTPPPAARPAPSSVARAPAEERERWADERQKEESLAALKMRTVELEAVVLESAKRFPEPAPAAEPAPPPPPIRPSLPPSFQPSRRRRKAPTR